MTTFDLVRRMGALGWEIPHEITVTPDSRTFYDDGDGDVELTDQRGRDLLACDFERWLIGNGHYVGYSSVGDLGGEWSVSVGKNCDTDPDKLSALVESAEAALKEQA